MSLLNVRLDRDLERKVQALRKDGLVISTLVREAITGAYARRKSKTPLDRSSLLDQIHQTYPTDYISLGEHVNLADRREAHSAIRQAMQAKKRGRR